jgi:hypothetical protein
LIQIETILKNFIKYVLNSLPGSGFGFPIELYVLNYIQLLILTLGARRHSGKSPSSTITEDSQEEAGGG